MINLLANKLPSVTDGKNIIWKNVDNSLYNKFNQSNLSNINTVKKELMLPEVSVAIKEETLSKPILPSLTEAKVENEVISVSNVSKNVPRVLKVTPIKHTSSFPKGLSDDDMQLKDNDKSKKNAKKPNPINIILEESVTCDIYKNDVKDKLISFVSSIEFSKVFGATKSAEIMSGIVNERVNKSVALFISFLFDKRVLYNEKEIIYDKNKEYVGIINV
jgi:hypothetical protein